ncbi:MAG: hypothetical protein RIM72_23315 [Alphaproteobacteria bacterium]
MKFVLALHRAAVTVYLSLCPIPPGNSYLYGAFGLPAPTSGLRDRLGQLLAFAVLGLPPMAVIPFLTGALPDYARIVATVYLGAVLCFLASVDVAAKKQAVDDLRAFDRERL